ncbi:MAG: hypothetical protein BroJett003_01260 [Planctomycetota bacterium]|nr:MAG: hypothetical protein BroJett003_01260 [Planctomycetota bacterium]
MTQTYTTTETWSRTHARYAAGKVAADLRQMQQAYGRPSDTDIENYLQELTELLAGAYVKEVSYGFRRDGVWVAALKYTADMYGNLTADDRSGRIPRGADITGATWYSFLSYSSKWDLLTPGQRKSIERDLPFARSSGVEPVIRNGSWSLDKTYSAVGCGLRRATIGGGV